MSWALFVFWMALAGVPEVEPSLLSAGYTVTDERPSRPEPFSLSANRNETLPEHGAASSPGPWFMELRAASNFMSLQDSRWLIDRRMNQPLGWMPGYSAPRDFYDLRRAGLLITGHVALGYMLNEWSDVTAEIGGGAWKLRSTTRPLQYRVHTDLEGRMVVPQVGLRLYPLRRPVHDPADPWNFLSGARPFIYQALGLYHITGKARVDAGLRGLPPLLRFRYRQQNLIPAYRLGAGIDFPVTRRLSLIAFGDYAFFSRRSDSFNGFAASLAIRFAF
jgi:hypothetical protein